MIEEFNPESQIQIKMTEKAVLHGKAKLDQNPGSEGIRLTVKKTGCSGYSYVTEYAASVNEDDVVFEQDHGVKVIVRKSDLPLIGGTVIDFQKKGLSSIFVFNNPNSKGECGCGESFTA